MTCLSKAFNLLGGEIVITLYEVVGTPCELLFDDIYDEALRLQRIFNFYDPNSELSLLNHKAKKKISKELLELVKMCILFCRLTKGAYDITKGKQFLQRKAGKPVTPVGCSYKDIHIDGEAITLNHPDAMIDLGSAAKGYIGDKLAEFIKKNGVNSALLDLRGDIIIFGEHTETINVQHPRQEGSYIASFPLHNKAVATSGDYKQYWGDHSHSHILGETDICSATVIADSLAKADILATCMFVAGTAGTAPFDKLHARYLLVDKNVNIINRLEEQP
jgi:FAD:protein FMN transferase